MPEHVSLCWLSRQCLHGPVPGVLEDGRHGSLRKVQVRHALDVRIAVEPSGWEGDAGVSESEVSEGLSA